MKQPSISLNPYIVRERKHSFATHTTQEQPQPTQQQQQPEVEQEDRKVEEPGECQPTQQQHRDAYF